MPISPLIRSEVDVSDSEGDDTRSIHSQGERDSASLDSENESDIDRELQDEQDDWLVEDDDDEEGEGGGDPSQYRNVQVKSSHSRSKEGKRKKKSKRRKHLRPSHSSDESGADYPRSSSHANRMDEELDEDDLELLRENTGMSIPSREEVRWYLCFSFFTLSFLDKVN